VWLQKSICSAREKGRALGGLTIHTIYIYIYSPNYRSRECINTIGGRYKGGNKDIDTAREQVGKKKQSQRCTAQ
jgi:hypothetical protein